MPLEPIDPALHGVPQLVVLRIEHRRAVTGTAAAFASGDLVAVRTRYRTPSISLRWNSAGLPVAATGNYGSRTAHRASLKSPRATPRSSRSGAIKATGF
jgi:hypothetical protein